MRIGEFKEGFERKRGSLDQCLSDSLVLPYGTLHIHVVVTAKGRSTVDVAEEQGGLQMPPNTRQCISAALNEIEYIHSDGDTAFRYDVVLK